MGDRLAGSICTRRMPRPSEVFFDASALLHAPEVIDRPALVSGFWV